MMTTAAAKCLHGHQGNLQSVSQYLCHPIVSTPSVLSLKYSRDSSSPGILMLNEPYNDISIA